MEHIIISSSEFELNPYHFAITPEVTLTKIIDMCRHEPTKGVPPDPTKLKPIIAQVGKLIKMDENDFKSLAFFGRYNDISYQNIAEMLPKDLKLNLLVLDGAYTDVGMAAMCETLKNSTVKKIHFGELTEKAVDVLLTYISEEKLNLEFVGFWEANIGRKVYERLFRVLQHNHTIEELWLPKSSELHTLPHEWIEECFSENSTLLKLNRDIFDLIKPVKWFVDRNRICKNMNVGRVYKNSIPQELQKDEDMQKFLEDLIARSEELRAMKLVVMGDGRIGKTTLLTAMKKILDPSYATEFESIVSTVGVECGTLKLAKGEISVWDFAGQMEYTATHSFFLSMEMTSMLVCFSLAGNESEQMRQITFWLDFLNSSLALPPLPSSSTYVPKWNIILVGVRSDEQTDHTLTKGAKRFINAWKRKWPRLPIMSDLFTVSAIEKNTERVEKLLNFVSEQCARILDTHTVRIPSTYHEVLGTIHELSKNEPYIQENQLRPKFSQQILSLKTSFQTMLQYFHSIGRIVLLPSGLVFTNPTLAPQIAAKFVSPVEVRRMLLKSEAKNVQILDKEEIGCLLDIGEDCAEQLTRELELMLHLKICFELRAGDTTSILYLFPSLSSEQPVTRFSLKERLVTGMRFVAPEGVIFVHGFFCQLLVQLFTSLNVSS